MVNSSTGPPLNIQDSSELSTTVVGLRVRDVTKFAFAFDDDDVQTSKVFSTFTTFAECFKRLSVECEFTKKLLVLRVISYA